MVYGRTSMLLRIGALHSPDKAWANTHVYMNNTFLNALLCSRLAAAWAMLPSRCASEAITRHGLDFAPATIGLLRKHFPDLPFKQGDIRDLPYSDSHFDGYISLGVIEHFLTGQHTILQEAARVLRPGGTIFLSVPAYNGYRQLRGRIGGYQSISTQPFFEDCYSEQELFRLLEGAGFAPEEVVYGNTVMTFVQETPLRPIYRRIEDLHYIRGPVDRVLRKVLPRSWFGHMIMVVAKKYGAGNTR